MKSLVRSPDPGESRFDYQTEALAKTLFVLIGSTCNRAKCTHWEQCPQTMEISPVP